MNKLIACIFTAGLMLDASAYVRVGSLTVEGLTTPLNIEADAPRLSWIITSDSHDVSQTSYRILVSSSPELLASGKGDIWDSGKVASDRSVLVPYSGPALKDNTRVYWTVKAYTNRGETLGLQSPNSVPV